ncbi:MAG: phenylpyruvate tautomerase MIF-related protein [Bacteroidales bacterium]|nr:phenylpyruvate tautomerase MIF-related protein [Bacteroidales bacterium]
MPVLKIQTNVQHEEKQQLMKEATQLVAELLEKPEKFIMVHLETNHHMMFGGNVSGLIYAELKSIGLPVEKTKELSESV